MNHERFEMKLIQQQNLYIQKLEEQLKTCEELIQVQEAMIEDQKHAFDLLAEEISKLDSEKDTVDQEEL